MDQALADGIEESFDIHQFTAYSLLDDETRRQFLFTLYWFGEVALFAAVSHVWDRLAEPREWRCTQMGQLSGAGGQGKTALLLTLKKFLGDALGAVSPLPERADFSTLEAWHAASMNSFANDEKEVAEICRRYAAIINGDVPIIERT